MGVLLYHQQAEDPVRTVFLKMNHETGHKDYQMRPIYPPEGYVPSIEELLFSADVGLVDIKFKLLKWIIDAEELLRDCDLKTIPKSYLVDVLLLLFLVKVIVEAFNSNC